MDQELRTKSIEAVRAMKDMAKDGQITTAILHKSLVCLAYEFAVGQETGWVTKLLLEVPMSYYKEEQPQHIVDDPKYAELCLDLSRLLVLYGMVDIGPIITQSPGVA